MPLSTKQVQYVNIALRAAGLADSREKKQLYLRQFADRYGRSLESTKDLSTAQFEQVLADCRDLGWTDTSNYRHDQKHRQRNVSGQLTNAQLDKIWAFGWSIFRVGGLAQRMFKQQNINRLTEYQASNLIEAMKNITDRELTVTSKS